MIEIVSWNIQNGKGVDDIVSIERIGRVIRELGDPDVICLQEVSRHLKLFGGVDAPDQIAELARCFPGYEPFFGIALEAGGANGGPRWQFGNVTLTRLPARSVFLHPLPRPAAPGIRHMPRQAIELTVETQGGPLRIVNTHLEYHSQAQRLAQVGRLCEIHEEISANAKAPPTHDPSGPYQAIARTERCVICGDFNMAVDSPEYRAMLGPHGQALPLVDAWRQLYGTRPHEPTCGLFDHKQWPEGAHCRDFFFMTSDMATNFREIAVDTETNASDHQPLVLRGQSGLR